MGKIGRLLETCRLRIRGISLPLCLRSAVSQSELSSPAAMENGATIGNVVAKEEGRFEWVIPEFSTFPQRSGAHFDSPEFAAESERWYLRIFPNGTSSDTRIHIALCRTPPRNRKSAISCTVGLRPADQSEETIGTKTWYVLFSSSFVFDRTRRELERGWLPGGQLTVTCLIGEASQAKIKLTPCETNTRALEAKIRKAKAKIKVATPEEQIDVQDAKMGKIEKLEDDTESKGPRWRVGPDFDVGKVKKNVEFQCDKYFQKKARLRKMLIHDSRMSWDESGISAISSRSRPKFSAGEFLEGAGGDFF